MARSRWYVRLRPGTMSALSNTVLQEREIPASQNAWPVNFGEMSCVLFREVDARTVLLS